MMHILAHGTRYGGWWAKFVPLLAVILLLAGCGDTAAPTATAATGGAAATPATRPTTTAAMAGATPAATAAGAAVAVAPNTNVMPSPVATQSAAGKSGGVYRSAFRTGCMEGAPWTSCGSRLDSTVMQNLAAIKWTGDSLQPLLAESWNTPDSGKTWIINLRKGVKWHDGAPFNADDVLYSFNIYANPMVASTFASKVQDIAGYDDVKTGKTDKLSGITKTDDTTVKIALTSAQPLWMQLDQIFVIMLPQHLLASIPPANLKGNPFWEKRVGTGPFKWNEYKTDQYVLVDRNPDYYLGAPKLDRVEYRIYADINTLLNAVEKGEVDDVSFEGGGIPETETARFQKNTNLITLDKLNAGLPTWIQWDISKAPFSDLRFRQAAEYAIDKDAIINSVLLGLYKPAYTEFPQDWAVPSSGLNKYAYDPNKAKQLLADMGYKGDKEIDFIYYYTDNVTKDVITALQQYLGAVGIKIKPRLLNPAAINAVYSDKTFEMGYFAVGMGLDPSLGAAVPMCGVQLALGYCNKRVDELFTQGAASGDQKVRAPAYQEISTILNTDLQKGYLWYAARPLAFNKRVNGLAEHWQQQPVIIFNTPVYQEIEKWYING